MYKLISHRGFKSKKIKENTYEAIKNAPEKNMGVFYFFIVFSARFNHLKNAIKSVPVAIKTRPNIALYDNFSLKTM